VGLGFPGVKSSETGTTAFMRTLQVVILVCLVVIATKTVSVREIDKVTSTTISLLIIAANRPIYLQRCLSVLLIYHPRHNFPITISQHGNNSEVGHVISSFTQAFQAHSPLPVRHLRFEGNQASGYAALSAHYASALGAVFDDPSVEFVTILEEDLVIAPDFFELFAATARTYVADPLIMAVSAWNDNGFEGRVKNASQLYRSDFFPGLGWMMHRRIWQELGPSWPSIYWDDWLRAPEQRKGRHFIRPEVCRTMHIGVHGVSNHQFGGYLTKIKLNDKYVLFSKLDLSYIATQQAWERSYFLSISQAATIPSHSNLAAKLPTAATFKIFYEANGSEAGANFAHIAHSFGLMPDFKFGVPRTGYKGIVSFWVGEGHVHLVPSSLQAVLAAPFSPGKPLS
jgi:alpha-1,3-mannosyl-glycoprotein beta-1,2-N-acetylglucosaminyltransferase